MVVSADLAVTCAVVVLTLARDDAGRPRPAFLTEPIAKRDIRTTRGGRHHDTE